METIRTWTWAHYRRALVYLTASALRCREVVVGRFYKQPQVTSAVLVVVLGMLAILIEFPTKQGSTTLAGALFGAGAAFIGAWVAEKNRTAAEKIAEARRMEAARIYFTPELARIIAHQVWVLGRLVPNFSMASLGETMPQVESWETFRPRRPILYPAVAQFKDLSEADATALIDFYDSAHGIAETIETWIETKTPQDVNAWNVLMQDVRNSLGLGAIAVRRLCPDRQLGPLLPASGTLLHNIERTSGMVQTVLDAHIARGQAKSAAPKPASRR